MIVAIYAKEHSRGESATVIDYVEMTEQEYQEEAARVAELTGPVRNERKWEMMGKYPKARNLKHLVQRKID
jgi:hypothetical protein